MPPPPPPAAGKPAAVLSPLWECLYKELGEEEKNTNKPPAGIQRLVRRTDTRSVGQRPAIKLGDEVRLTRSRLSMRRVRRCRPRRMTSLSSCHHCHHAITVIMPSLSSCHHCHHDLTVIMPSLSSGRHQLATSSPPTRIFFCHVRKSVYFCTRYGKQKQYKKTNQVVARTGNSHPRSSGRYADRERDRINQ